MTITTTSTIIYDGTRYIIRELSVNRELDKSKFPVRLKALPKVQRKTYWPCS